MTNTRIISNVLSTGYAVGLGFLSFVGMMALVPSVPVAIVAMVFAGVVVGQVYRGNIENALKRLSVRDYFLKNIINDWLLEYFDGNPELTQERHAQLLAYREKKLRLAQLQAIHHPEAAAKQELDDLTAALLPFEEACFRYYQAPNDYVQDTNKFEPTKAELELIFELKAQAKIASAQWWQRWVITPSAIVIGIMAGFSLGLTTAASTSSALISVGALLGLSIGTTAAAATGIGVAVIAAIAYTFAIYYTLSKILGDTKIQSLKQRTIDRLTDPRLSLTKRFAIAAAAIIAIGLAIAATVLTAGGWWIAAEKGAQLLPVVQAKAAQLFTAITTPFYAIGSCCFFAFNSIGTLLKAQYGFKNPLKILHKKVLDKIDSDGWLELLNIPRLLMVLLATTFKSIVFLVHVVSEALVAVKEGGGDCASAAIVAAFVDLFTDANSVFSPPEDTQQEGEQASDPGFRARASSSEPHEHGILDAFVYVSLVVMLAPLHLFAAAWNCAVSNCGRNDDKKIGFVAALQESWQSFHGECHDHDGHSHGHCGGHGHGGGAGHVHGSDGHRHCAEDGHSHGNGHSHGLDVRKQAADDKRDNRTPANSTQPNNMPATVVKNLVTVGYSSLSSLGSPLVSPLASPLALPERIENPPSQPPSLRGVA